MEKKSMVKRQRMVGAAPVVIANEDFINNLPDDCLFHIFSFLTLADRLGSITVCKRWKDFGSEAWRDVKKLDFITLENIKTQHTRLLALCGGFLKDLTISVSRGSNIIRVVTTNCSNLSKFRARFEYNQRDKAEHCKDLEKLFVKNREKLRSVVLDNLGRDYADHTNFLLELPEELVELQLWGVMAHGEDHEFSWRRTRCPSFILHIGRLKNLEILALNGFTVGQDAVTMIGNMENLRYLEIYHSTLLSLDISSISSRRKLEYVSLSGVETDSWINDFVDNNPDLKHLKLNRCRLSGVANRKLFQFSKLETLSLMFCIFNADSSFNLSGFRNLKKLIFTHIHVNDIMTLMEITPELEFVHSDGNQSDPGILRKAHEVASRRVNNIPLHVVLHPQTIYDWQKPEYMPSLLIVETSDKYGLRTMNKYNGYDVELSH